MDIRDLCKKVGIDFTGFEFDENSNTLVTERNNSERYTLFVVSDDIVGEVQVMHESLVSMYYFFNHKWYRGNSLADRSGAFACGDKLYLFEVDSNFDNNLWDITVEEATEFEKPMPEHLNQWRGDITDTEYDHIMALTPEACAHTIMGIFVAGVLKKTLTHERWADTKDALAFCTSTGVSIDGATVLNNGQCVKLFSILESTFVTVLYEKVARGVIRKTVMTTPKDRKLVQQDEIDYSYYYCGKWYCGGTYCPHSMKQYVYVTTHRELYLLNLYLDKEDSQCVEVYKPFTYNAIQNNPVILKTVTVPCTSAERVQICELPDYAAADKLYTLAAGKIKYLEECV